MSIRERLSNLTRGKWAFPVAALLGFLENTIVIMAMEPLFIPMMASRGRGAWKVALALLVGNVAGGLAIYAIGAQLAEGVLQPLIAQADLQAQYEQAVTKLKENGFVALFLIGVTPFPFQVGAAAAGAANYSLPMFVIAVAISRAIRYFGLAALVMLMGQRANEFIEKHELEIFIAGALIFVAIGAYMLLS